ncbi:MAG: nitrous oxide-stimulated promoter family protein [Chloroflexi bacterium]|nr:nitrous oxide-stimulated promoter family protein [Chloroflexota bacterium]
MKNLAKILQQEQATLEQIIGLYCHTRHRTKGSLCVECQELLDYARERVSHCQFLPDKPVCARCPVHCYKRSYREKVREMMRFAGPRLIFKDPIAVVRHFRLNLRQDSEQVAKARARSQIRAD